MYVIVIVENIMVKIMPNTIDPSQNNNEDNNDFLDRYNSQSQKIELPVEKQFTQTVFCQQIQNIDLNSAKELLSDLHMLYLGQQALMVKLAKRDIESWNNNGS